MRVGDAVRSAKQPGLGTGLLISLELQKARVFFPGLGERAFHPFMAAVEAVIATAAEEAVFAILRDIQPCESDDRAAHYRVYAIELSNYVRNDYDFRTRNPQMRADRAYLYVGGTGITPEERSENHRAGYKSSRYPKRYGQRLRPDIYGHFPAVRWERIQLLEPAFAELLRSWGHGVWQN